MGPSMSLQPDTSASTPAQPEKGGVVVPNRPRWYQWIAAWVIVVAVRTLSATMRYRWYDNSEYYTGTSSPPAIYAAWHNRLLLVLPAYYSYARKHSTSCGMAAMVSASKDGGFLAAILECFNVEPVRGSTSRRGPQALLELTTCAKRGFDLAITPDGPRGPRYQVQDGVMSLAQITGLPIILSRTSCDGNCASTVGMAFRSRCRFRFVK